MTANAVAIILEPVFNPELRRVAPATVPFDPQRHPRWPGGRPDGGQFRPRDGAGPVLPTGGKAEAVRRILDGLLRLWRSLRRVPDPPKPESPSAPRPSEPAPKPTPQEPAPPREAEPDERPTPGIGHNRPPSEAAPDVEPSPPTASGARQPFKLPIERPTREGEVARWGQKAADEIREALANNDTHRLTEIEDALAHADWIKPQLDNIIAAQDPPRSLDDLIEAAQEKGRRFGYDNHHIIEQGPQNSDVPRDVVDAPYNIVRIPRYKHWEINDYYGRPHGESGGVSPREYLKGKSPAERYQFGLGVLRKFGVLQ